MTELGNRRAAMEAALVHLQQAVIVLDKLDRSCGAEAHIELAVGRLRQRLGLNIEEPNAREIDEMAAKIFAGRHAPGISDLA